MGFLTRRARTNGNGKRQCARCGGALTYADEWGQRCPHCYQWLPIRNVLAPDGTHSCPTTGASSLRDGTDGPNSGSAGIVNAGNIHKSGPNGARAEMRAAAATASPNVEPQTCKPPSDASLTREAGPAGDIGTSDLRHDRDQLRQQVATLQRQLNDASIERAQLMGFIAYLLGRALLAPPFATPAMPQLVPGTPIPVLDGEVIDAPRRGR